MHFLLYVYYTHPGYRTSICGKNCAYCIRILTVLVSPNMTITQCLNNAHYFFVLAKYNHQ